MSTDRQTRSILTANSKSIGRKHSIISTSTPSSKPGNRPRASDERIIEVVDLEISTDLSDIEEVTDNERSNLSSPISEVEEIVEEIPRPAAKNTRWWNKSATTTPRNKEEVKRIWTNLLTRAGAYSNLLKLKDSERKFAAERGQGESISGKRKQRDYENLCKQAPPFKRANHGAGDAASSSSSGGPYTNCHPKFFTGGTLRDYQLMGLEWMKGLYDCKIGGILADEMGLGKTVQVIAFICHLLEKGPGPFLIVVPLSTTPNWINEFERFAPEVPVVKYHGDQAVRKQLHKKIKKQLPVVLTTYDTVVIDAPFLSKFEWKHIIVDEAQRLKNPTTKLRGILKEYFKTPSKLVLTGTPVQNNLSELWSLLNFLNPNVFPKLEWFDALFGAEVTQQGLINREAIKGLAQQEEKDQMLLKFHKVLSPFLLRRLKVDVEISLPTKKEVLVYAPMTTKQTELYNAGREKIHDLLHHDDTVTEFKVEILPDNVRLRSQVKTTKKPPPDPVFQNLGCLSVAIILFRKITMHPYLLERPLKQEGGFLNDERLISESGKMLVLDRLLKALKERGHKVLLFSTMVQMLNILQDYCEWRNFKYCRLDGSMKLSKREMNINKFDDPDHFIFLISTRAGGVGLNLMAADTVVIYDSDWNPQCDLQAMDRCHRIGQTRPVIVYRLVTQNTIDQRVIDRAAAKRGLEKMVMHSGQFKEMAAVPKPLGMTELTRILESRDYNEYRDVSKDVISDQELERLLNRDPSVDQDSAAGTSGAITNGTATNKPHRNGIRLP